MRDCRVCEWVKPFRCSTGENDRSEAITIKGAPMSENAELAASLTSSLELALPPVAVAFTEAVPAGVAPYDGVAPAGCFFWQQAATRTFATSAKDHALCSIGTYTHHLAEPAPSHQTELAEALQAMSALDYVRAEEAAAIPVIEREVKHVVYGPLAESPIEPDVVLIFAHARQGLILSEAIARVDNGVPPALGRPACAVIPQAFNHGTAALSLGCCGARAYLDALTDAVSLWALPARKLKDYCSEIATLARANKTLTAFHLRRREDVEAGKQPTVCQSLERLSS
jgi:uncharacterized protein (DUF169 family)